MIFQYIVFSSTIYVYKDTKDTKSDTNVEWHLKDHRILK